MFHDLKEVYYKAVAQMLKSRPKAVRYCRDGLARVNAARRQKSTERDCRSAITRAVRELCEDGRTRVYSPNIAEWFVAKGYNVKQDGLSNGFVIVTDASEKELSDIMMS